MTRSGAIDRFKGGLVAGRFGATIAIERPIAEVFAFLADGENDKRFSTRVIEIAKTTDGPAGVGTVYASTVKDAGVKTQREFKLTEFQAPTRIRWTELSKNAVTVPEGGYDLVAEGDRTQLTFFNELKGHGLGVLFAGFALRSARNSADAFAGAIKAAIEAS
jgi:Polyketide cyclase / dehydrase and lipid transport